MPLMALTILTSGEEDQGEEEEELISYRTVLSLSVFADLIPNSLK